MTTNHSHFGDMVRHLPFPYEGERFPAELGVVVQRTVLDESEPARVVIHDSEGDWMIGDGRNDPNEPGACLATHIAHVLTIDPSLAELATVGPGHQAERSDAGSPWRISVHVYDKD